MEDSARILTLPNILSFARLVLAIPLVLLFMWERDLDWALILFVAASITDTLDGLLARLLKQKSKLGMYLDPIADKLLLSSSFLVLALTGEIPWLVTGLVLARDVAITSGALWLMRYRGIKDFPPSALGKVNTTVQMAAVFAVLLYGVYPKTWLGVIRKLLVWGTPVLVVSSGTQYLLRALRRLRQQRDAATAA